VCGIAQAKLASDHTVLIIIVRTHDFLVQVWGHLQTAPGNSAFLRPLVEVAECCLTPAPPPPISSALTNVHRFLAAIRIVVAVRRDALVLHAPSPSVPPGAFVFTKHP
jgi:hypothetical protein